MTTRQSTSGRLRITEIFLSLQGESLTIGCPTVFVRLTGCPLRCGYCDTTYAFQGGEWMDVAEILQQVEVGRNRYENLEVLADTDQVKFVICSREDYDWARQVLERHDIAHRCTVLFSPAHGQQDPTELADWILQDRLPVRMQMQLHKYLWGNEPGR
jgi:organic radical activating enzyme